MSFENLVQKNKQEALDWFFRLDEKHRLKMTPYPLRRFLGKRIFEIEKGRELDDFDKRWITKFGAVDFIKKFY